MMNKHGKRALSLILVVLMVAALLPTIAIPVIAASDIEGHWAQETLEEWISLGLLSGDGDGKYRPKDSISRAEFIALVNRWKGFTTESESVKNYTDVSPQKWYYKQIAIALQAGYINGTSETTMSPEANITREQVMLIAARLAGFDLSLVDTTILNKANDGNEVSVWARNAVAAVINDGIVAGSNGNITPQVNITRAEAIVLLDRIRTDTRIYGFSGTFGPESGVLEVASVTIAANGVTVRNMNVSGGITVTAGVGNGNVAIDGVTVKGKLYILGGGLDSIKISNSKLSDITVDKDYVRIVLDNSTVSGIIQLNEKNDIVEFIGKTKIETINVGGSATVVKAGAEVSIGTLNVKADNVKVETTAGTTIGTVNLDGKTTITGEGKINVANIHVNGCSIETKPGTTNIDIGLSAEIAGQTVTGGNVVISGGGSDGAKTVNIASVTSLTPTVNHKSTYVLPATVTSLLADGTGKVFNVAWSDIANTSNCGVFVFEGTLQMEQGYTNLSGIKAKLTLTVVPVLVSIKITQQPTVTLYLQDEPLDITGLVITGEFSDGSEEIVNVTAENVTGYSANTFDKPQNLAVTIDGVSAQFPVTVYHTATGTYTGFNPIAAVTVLNGAEKTPEGLGLPPRVVITVEDTAAKEVKTLANVKWYVASASYDKATKTAQNFTVTGEISLPDDVDNSGAKPIAVDIGVTVSAAKYTVKFDLNGQPGIAIPSKSIEYDNTVAKPPDPTSVTHKFVDWYQNANLSGAPWNFETKVRDNLTLYAKWELNKYEITFSQGLPETPVSTDLPGPRTVEHGSVATKPTDPTLSDYTFSGWFTDAGCTKQYDWNAPVTAKVTLFAKFTERNPPEIIVESKDSRFAVGYPKVSFDKDGKAIVKLKLNEGEATEAEPVIAYIVVDDYASDYDTLDSESILYGHGISKTTAQGGKRYASSIYNVFDKVIDGNGEFSAVAEYDTLGSGGTFRFGIVLLKNDDKADLSKTPTVITVKVAKNEYVDKTPPNWMVPYLSEDKRIIYVYFYEKLSTTLPATTDWEISGAEGSVTINSVRIDNSTETYAHFPGCVTLTLSGELSGTNMSLKYKSGGQKLADANNNVVDKDITAKIIVTPPSVIAYVNPAAGTMMVRFVAGLKDLGSNNASVLAKNVTLRHNNTQVTGFEYIDMDWPDNDMTEVYYRFDPPGGQITDSGFTISVTENLTFWSNKTIKVQNAAVVIVNIPAKIEATAEYSSWSDHGGLIAITFPTDFNTYGFSNILACNFKVTVDEKQVFYRESANAGANELYLPISSQWLIKKLDSGSEIKVSYELNANHIPELWSVLCDITGAHITSFGPITVTE